MFQQTTRQYVKIIRKDSNSRSSRATLLFQKQDSSHFEIVIDNKSRVETEILYINESNQDLMESKAKRKVH